MPRIELGSERIHRQTSTSVVGQFVCHLISPGQQGHHLASRFVLIALSGIARGTPAFVTPASLAAGDASERTDPHLGGLLYSMPSLCGQGKSIVGIRFASCVLR